MTQTGTARAAGAPQPPGGPGSRPGFPPVWETFTRGLSTTGPDARWFHVQAGGYAADDGIVTPLPGGGVRIAPAGRNAATGRPAFRRTLPHESAGGVPATNDHAKWLAYMNRQSAAGFPGFDAAEGFELTGTACLGGETFGTGLHPFGSAVADAENDLRLSAFAMTTIDVETFMVFDFLFTNRGVYAFYERLPFARTPDRPYAAFSYAIPVARRSPADEHEAGIAYDRSAGIVRWILDGIEVYRVGRIGRRLPSREHMLLDLGGADELVSPRQLDFGMGLFTLLDGAAGAGPGLVRLSSELRYFAPDRGEPHELAFVDEASTPESRLFGQGAELRLAAYAVTCTPSTTLRAAAAPRAARGPDANTSGRVASAEDASADADPIRHVPAGEGAAVWAAGDTYTFKARAADTGGRLTMWEAEVPPGGGPPPHRHLHQDEAYYLLEGELEVLDGGRLFTARAGDFVFIPRGAVHRFRNAGRRVSRMLIWMSPAGFEDFLSRVGQPALAGGHAPPPGPEEIARSLAIAGEHGLEIIAPAESAAP